MEKVIQIHGYLKIVIENGIMGNVFLYIGDNYVCFTPEEWETFQKTVVDFKSE